MAHPIYKDLLEQWREKAKEIAGTSEGFTFYDPEFNEFLHWMFSQFQGVIDSTQSNPGNNVAEFINKAVELENHYPFLYVEIARTIRTDWMAWLKEDTRCKDSLAQGQGLTAEEACEDALKCLPNNLKVVGASND
ncbi:hypothetical protein [Microbulbifer sp. VAAF005]|uniref:hypothetical protein n=1 Tax=Microbulbifer sp. VAAF005 TaxID=3034230 RepID=UPI0024AE1486|nr:hypothetical protein [Microbulbifer sp. VAAF005]WHI46554.1 hypothetical protein P0078_23085 [Microbulbifer sp. VAAF005]